MAAILAMALLATACGQDVAITCVAGADAQTIDKTYRQVDPLWRRELGGDMLTNPIASDGVLYIATSGINSPGDGDVFALDATTGEELWRYQMLNNYDFAEDASATVLFEDSLYVVPQSDGDMHVFDRATGQVRWRAPYPGRGSQPVISSGSVYTKPSTGGPLQARDAGTGELLWEYSEAKFFGYSRLAVSEDAVYGATWLDIRALERDTGQLRWVWASEGDTPERGLHVAGGIVYGLSEGADGSLYAIDAATGEQMWRRGLSAQSIVLRNDTVYVGSGESPVLQSDHPGPVRALDAATGEERWRSETCGRPFAGPDGILHVVNGWLFSALNQHTGERLWSYDLDPRQIPTQLEDEVQASELELLVAGSHRAEWLTSPVWKGDEVHLASADGRVFALDAFTGELRWQSDAETPIATEYFLMTLGDYIHRVPAVEDEVVYVTNGGLVAYSARGQ